MFLSFNPHPARRPDAIYSPISTGTGGKFQSSPGQKAGCNLNPAATVVVLAKFQSSPGQKAGCNRGRRFHRHVSAAFQSSPGQKAGCNSNNTHRDQSLRLFQSSPGQKAGCNVRVWTGPSTLRLFQSSPGQKAGCNRLYLNFLSVLREPPDTGFSICFHCPDHFFPTATIQLRTRTYKLRWLQHVVRVRPPAVP